MGTILKDSQRTTNLLRIKILAKEIMKVSEIAIFRDRAGFVSEHLDMAIVHMEEELCQLTAILEAHWMGKKKEIDDEP